MIAIFTHKEKQEIHNLLLHALHILICLYMNVALLCFNLYIHFATLLDNCIPTVYSYLLRLVKM